MNQEHDRTGCGAVGEQLNDLSRLYAHLLMAVDGLWFLGVEKSAGIDEALRLDEEVWRQLGKIESKRIKDLLGIDRLTTVEEFRDILVLIPLMVKMDPVTEISDGKLTFSVTECTIQRTRVRKGLGEFPCKSVNEAWLEGITSALGSHIHYRCVVCPPDDHPDDLWCQWEVWIDSVE